MAFTQEITYNLRMQNGHSESSSVTTRRWYISRRRRVRGFFGVLAAWSVLAIVAQPAAAQRVLRVNARATGMENGTSWSAAFCDLQDALTVARPGDEIWVAAGLYTPDRGTGDRTMSFVLSSGVALYGGFAGWETNREQRDWVKHETILSGDLAGDDGPRDCAEVSNCCREHDAPGCDNAMCEALVCPPGSPCCEETDETQRAWSSSCVQIAERACCDVGHWNACENSKVIINADAADFSTVLDGFTVTTAYASFARGDEPPFGAGIWSYGGSLQVANCLFRDHGTVGMRMHAAGAVTLRASTFRDNLDVGASLRGGVIEVSDCAFTRNGGGLIANGRVTVSNCLVYENKYGAGFGGEPTVVDCAFFRNDFRGLSFGGDPATMINCAVIDNGGPGMETGGNPTVIGSLFMNNWGSGLSAHAGTTTLIDCAVLGNTGWGVFVFYAGLRMNNCIVSGNHSSSADGMGAGIAIDHASVLINNSTIAGNYAAVGIDLDTEGRVILNNSIVWGNTHIIQSGESAQIFVGHETATVDVDYSLIEGWTGSFGGVGNAGDDPRFVDADGADDTPGTADDDLRLLPDSPAINAGDPTLVPQPGETDFDGRPRILCGQVDIGAFEFGIGDHDCDGVADLFDFAAWPSCMTGPNNGPHDIACETFDFDADADIDLADFAAFHRLFNGP